MANYTEDNFDPKKEIRQVSDVLTQSDKFAEVFINAMQKSKPMDDAISKTMKSLIQSDSSVQSELKKLIKEIETEEWRSWLRKFGIAIWSVLVFIIGVLATVLAQHFLA